MSSESLDASANFVNKDSSESINININGVPIILRKGDCIQFSRALGDGENILTIAKILGFANSGNNINRIFFLPWREEGHWGPTGSRMRAIGLTGSYVLTGYPGFGKPEWQTIKLVPCPEQAGGKRKNRKSTKKTQRIRKRQSRK